MGMYLAADHHSEDVGLHNVNKVALGGLNKRLEGVGIGAGIVDPDVYVSEATLCFLHQSLDICCLADVAGCPSNTVSAIPVAKLGHNGSYTSVCSRADEHCVTCTLMCSLKGCKYRGRGYVGFEMRAGTFFTDVNM